VLHRRTAHYRGGRVMAGGSISPPNLVVRPGSHQRSRLANRLGRGRMGAVMVGRLLAKGHACVSTTFRRWPSPPSRRTGRPRGADRRAGREDGAAAGDLADAAGGGG
jgi:hypothetical protein